MPGCWLLLYGCLLRAYLVVGAIVWFGLLLIVLFCLVVSFDSFVYFICYLRARCLLLAVCGVVFYCCGLFDCCVDLFILGFMCLCCAVIVLVICLFDSLCLGFGVGWW